VVSVNIIVAESLLGLFDLWIAPFYLWWDFRNDAYREDILSVKQRRRSVDL